MKDFVSEEKIRSILEKASNSPPGSWREILSRGREAKGLSPEDALTILFHCEDEELFLLAGEIKERIYGNRIVLFAPLYITSYCANDCPYCGFRNGGRQGRKRLEGEELEEEVRLLLSMGHRRLLLVFGDDPCYDGVRLRRTIEKVYGIKDGNGGIRRVNINCAPLSAEEFGEIGSAGIGTYQLFQETYHRSTYRDLHARGPKADYEYRLTAFDRAIRGGIDDLGMGVLFGLYDHSYEVAALLLHARYLEERYGFGPHTVSVPRIKSAEGAPLSLSPPLPVSDRDLLRIVAVLRIALPCAGIILSTREPPDLRDRLFSAGVSQISAGSRTSVGGYRGEKGDGQFQIEDTRTLDEIVGELAEKGLIPSFCTSCYRRGRTGRSFMDVTRRGDIKRFCSPNALLTLKEFLLDYATPATSVRGERLIREEFKKMPPPLAKRVEDMCLSIEGGVRDLYI